MRGLAAPLLWLMLSASAGVCQSLSFPDGLEPFRINPVEVDHSDSVYVRLWGERFDGTVVPLYSGAGIPRRGGLLCWAYIDNEIRLLRGESRSFSGDKAHFAAEVRRSEFRISVYGFPGSLEGASFWNGVRSEEELGPGDIWVLSPGDDPAPIMAAGNHVLTTRARSSELRNQRNPWRGYLLPVSDLEADTLMEVLESRREEIIAFKQRYTNLPASLGFHGALVAPKDPLVFPASPPASIAQSLQGRTFGDRVGAPYRYALLAFSLAAIITVALARRWAIVLPLMGFLLAVFVVFTFAAPSSLRGLTLELALPASREESNGPMVALESLSRPGERILRYRQRDIPPGSRSLLYRSFLAPGGEAPLRLFASDRWVRFNQTPEVQQRHGDLILKFRNPLSSWSLHEPR